MRGARDSTTPCTSSSRTSRTRPADCGTSPPSGCCARSRPRPSPHAGGIDSERLEDAEEFLLRVRSMLHVQNGRDANVLTHELQEKVARPMGFDAPEPHQQVEALMSTYFRHARHVDRALAWSRGVVRPADPAAAAGPVTEHLSIAPDGVTFRDPARAAVQPSVWLDAFGLAIETGERVSDDVLQVVQANVGRYTAEYFVATAEARSAHAVDAPAEAGPVGAAVRHARLRPARRDLSGVRENPLPRDPRLLPQVHGGRAHAPHHPRTSSRSGIRQARAARGSVPS